MKYVTSLLLILFTATGSADQASNFETIIDKIKSSGEYVGAFDMQKTLLKHDYHKVSEIIPNGHDGDVTGPKGRDEAIYTVELFEKTGDIYCPKSIFPNYKTFLFSNDIKKKSTCIVIAVESKEIRKTTIRQIAPRENTL